MPPLSDCNIDVSVGIDVSGPVRSTPALHLKKQLQTDLPRFLQQVESLTNVCCISESQLNIRFKYQVFGPTGLPLFDSNFEKYNEEIIQKFLAAQITVDTYLNARFLQLLWEDSFEVASANVKVNRSVCMIEYWLNLYYSEYAGFSAMWILQQKKKDSQLVIQLKPWIYFHNIQMS